MRWKLAESDLGLQISQWTGRPPKRPGLQYRQPRLGGVCAVLDFLPSHLLSSASSWPTKLEQSRLPHRMIV